MKQKKKFILISGVSRGIGHAVALEFLKQKNIVFGISRKKITKKNELIKFNNFFHFQGDINNLKFLNKTKKNIEKKFKKLDVIILNAAILGEMKKIKESNIKIWEQVIKTNLIANYFIIKVFYDLINNSKFGRIISVTTTAAWKIRPQWSSYSVSKAGLEMFIKILCKENNNNNLKINFIDPGRVRTRMIAKAFPKQNFNKNILPEKIVDKFIFLSSEKCKSNGKIIKAQ